MMWLNTRCGCVVVFVAAAVLIIFAGWAAPYLTRTEIGVMMCALWILSMVPMFVELMRR